jgi:ABC-2 type transport system permease protein
MKISLIQHIIHRLRVIGFIVEKEFTQIFRNRFMLPFIFLMPLLQLLILVHAATFDMKEIRIVVVDNDLSPFSRRLTDKFRGSEFFTVLEPGFSPAEAEGYLKNNTTDIVLNIPADFEKKLIRENQQSLQLNINAINGTAAGLINYYSSSIIASFNREIIVEIYGGDIEEQMVDFNVTFSNWYNPQTDYKIYMFPGILVILITVIGMFLTALNIVREKEAGTIEQINVTPIKKYQFLAGKMIPFWIIGMLEIGFGILLGKTLFNIPIEGSLALLFFSGGVYLLVVLGLGLYLASISNRLQQVMFLSWFFMLVFILMSGLFTPIDSMPDWAKLINYLNPFAYFIRILRMILMKGSGLVDISGDLISLGIYAIVVLSLATASYSKKTA